MRKYCLSILLLFFLYASFINGQFFYKGEIVKANGEKIYGFIKNNGEIGNSKFSKFKEQKKDKAIVYQPSDLQSFHIYGKNITNQRSTLILHILKMYLLRPLLKEM